MSNAQIAVWIVLVVGWLSGFYVGYQLGKRAEYKRQAAEKTARLNDLFSGPFRLRPEMIIPGLKPSLDVPSHSDAIHQLVAAENARLKHMNDAERGLRLKEHKP